MEGPTLKRYWTFQYHLRLLLACPWTLFKSYSCLKPSSLPLLVTSFSIFFDSFSFYSAPFKLKLSSFGRQKLMACLERRNRQKKENFSWLVEYDFNQRISYMTLTMTSKLLGWVDQLGSLQTTVTTIVNIQKCSGRSGQCFFVYINACRLEGKMATISHAPSCILEAFCLKLQVGAVCPKIFNFAWQRICCLVALEKSRMLSNSPSPK